MCNIWRDTTFAVANELAIFAESLNLDIFEIIEKANFSYPRSAVPKPGPVGGPCLSKDTYLFLESLDENFADNSIILKSRKQNEALVNIAYNLILEYIDEKPNQNRICFLGAAFKGKPRTNDFRNSFTQELIHMVKESTVEIMVWDPTVKSEDLLDYSNYLNGNLNAKNTSIVIIGNNSDFFFDDVVLNFLTDLPTSSLIIDMWGVTRNIENIRSQVYKFGIKC
jgi:nucleotide sugar dehydrogenase